MIVAKQTNKLFKFGSETLNNQKAERGVPCFSKAEAWPDRLFSASIVPSHVGIMLIYLTWMRHVGNKLEPSPKSLLKFYSCKFPMECNGNCAYGLQGSVLNICKEF